MHSAGPNRLALGFVLAAISCGDHGGSPDEEESEPQAPRPAPSESDDESALPEVEPLDEAESSDGTSSCTVTADRDGDGVERTLNECVPEDPHALPTGGAQDCDDADPERSSGQQYYTDADGDGFGATHMQSAWGCRGDVIEGFAPNASDCDDSDATLHVWKYVDADGDGGGSGERQCVAEAAPGFSKTADDCNDEDPAIHWRAEGEQPLDELDVDCDGADFPVIEVQKTPEGGESVLGPLWAIPDAGRCDGVALSILAVERHNSCFGGFGLQIGNRGSVEIEGGMLLVQRDPGALEEFALPLLAPGEVVRSQRFGGGSYRVELMAPGEAAECTAMSETAAVEAAFVDCF